MWFRAHCLQECAQQLPQQYRVLLVLEDELILPPIVCSTLLWWRNAILFEVLLIALDACELCGDFLRRIERYQHLE